MGLFSLGPLGVFVVAHACEVFFPSLVYRVCLFSSSDDLTGAVSVPALTALV